MSDLHPINDAAKLLDTAAASTRVRTRTLATRVRRELVQLASMVAAERDVADLEARLSVARMRAAGRHPTDDDSKIIARGSGDIGPGLAAMAEAAEDEEPEATK